MVSSGMLRRVTLVRTDVSEELSASIRVTRISELGTTISVTSNRRLQYRRCDVASVQPHLSVVLQWPEDKSMSCLLAPAAQYSPVHSVQQLCDPSALCAGMSATRGGPRVDLPLYASVDSRVKP
jgi:hypothetical protein